MDIPIINPTKLKKEPTLTGKGLFIIHPTEARYAFYKVQDGKRHFLFNSNLKIYGNSKTSAPFFIAGPAVGAPMAVLVLEKLIALGASEIVVTGWCGAIDSSLSIGNIIVPTWSFSEEGTSAHYSSDARPHSDTTLRKKLFQFIANKGVETLAGPVWTTDAPYRETREKIAEYSSQGIKAVDMEFSALCTVANFRKVKLAGVFIVSDELYHEQWKPGFTSKAFKQKSNMLMELLIDFCKG